MHDICMCIRAARFKNRPLLSENRILGIKIRNFARGTIPLNRILPPRILTFVPYGQILKHPSSAYLECPNRVQLYDRPPLTFEGRFTHASGTLPGTPLGGSHTNISKNHNFWHFT